MKLFCGKAKGKTQTHTLFQPIRIMSYKVETNTIFFFIIHPAILNASRLTDLNLILYLLKKGPLFSSELFFPD